MISNLLWQEVQKFFSTRVHDFLSVVAFKWLCSRRYFQFNFVSFAVIWTIWNNRNSIVFNRNPWLNMKQVWQRLLRYLRDWKIPFKDQNWELVDRFTKLLITRLQTPLALMSA
jgi:hypothetical protein